jgi:hypothetical protein
MTSSELQIQIENLEFIEKPFIKGPGFLAIEKIWKDNFTDGELFIASHFKAADEQKFRSVFSKIDDFVQVEDAFFDHFFRNPTLKVTSLNSLGIGPDFRTTSSILKIPRLSLGSYFAHSALFSGQYFSKPLPHNSEAIKLGEALLAELYEDRYEDLICFFSDRSWTVDYENPQAFLNFIVFDKKNSQVDFILALTQY